MQNQQIARPTTAASGSSTRSLFSFNQKSLWLILKNSSWKSRLLDYAKLSMLILPPLIVVLALCGLSLISVNASIGLQTKLEENVRAAQAIGALVASLQRERGMTCVYITSLHNSNELGQKDAYAEVQKYRNETDACLKLIDRWLGNESDGTPLATKGSFQKALTEYRKTVGPRMADCDINIKFYTDIDNRLIEQMNKAFQQTEDGRFWAAVESYHTLLLTKDYMGLQRTMGGSFFVNGGFSNLDSFAQFARANGAADQLLSMALYLTPEAKSFYEKGIVENNHLMTQLGAMKRVILENDTDVQVEQGFDWFRNMTSYITIITAVENLISDLIISNLHTKLSQRQMEYGLTVSAVVAVLLLCPPLTIWYAIQSRRLMNRIKKFTEKLTQQTKELNMEKKRTDLLLYQLLPKSVVADLKQNKHVPPEHYESATIYFSDIQGFTSLSCKSTPFQVVDLLNKLYTKCDSILDQYDVYKVETIGDAYMVVSGVPKRNGSNHCVEIATMSLNIMMAMEEFSIPHMPNEKLLVRIGIHTGPVAAAVIGTKMPRYCLFGDTVNTASRMESNGLAMRIHISQTTRDLLELMHSDVFEMRLRGSLEMKGKGTMNTYWLIAKRDFPYRMDPDHAEEMVNKSSYWKL